MLLARFWKNREASIAPLMAVALIPLVGFVGAAVDYTPANAARAAFQTALDSTALMLSKTAANQTPDEIQASALSILKALFTREASNISVTANFTSGGGSTITLTGSATVATDFLNLIGYNDIAIGATAVVTWGNTRLRVALVLDNTGSMLSSGKLTALKTASQNLLTQL